MTNPDAEALIARWGETVARTIARAMGDNFSDAFKNKARWIAKRGMSGGRFRDVNEPYQGDYLDAAAAAIRALLPAIEQARRDALEEAATVAMAYRAWVNWTGDTFPDEPGTSIRTLSPLPDTKGGE